MHDVVNKSSNDEYFGKIGINHVISTFALSNTKSIHDFFFKSGPYYIN